MFYLLSKKKTYVLFILVYFKIQNKIPPSINIIFIFLIPPSIYDKIKFVKLCYFCVAVVPRCVAAALWRSVVCSVIIT